MKRKYLYRLLLIMISLLFVPIMIISTLFWRNSLKELRIANDTYQEKILSGYAGILDEMVTDFTECAAYISAESKKSESYLFDGTQGLENDYFRMYQIAKELTDLNPYIGLSEDAWGIYLYDIDKIIRPGTTSAIKDVFPGIETEEELAKDIATFFSKDAFKWPKKTFCTTHGEGEDGSLLIGIYTYVGVYQDEALVYFMISPSDMEKKMTIMDGSSIGFSLVQEDAQKTLLTWGTQSIKEVYDYRKQETTLPGLSIIAALSEDTLEQNLYEYAMKTGRLMVALAIILFICCIGAVYISYKPIRQLTSGLAVEDEIEKTSEIEVIKNVMERDRTIIETQRGTITDLLLSHLLHGGHISQERIERLGVEEDMKYYTVFLLGNHMLERPKAKEIIAVAKEHFDTHLLVLHLEETNKSAFIVFSKSEETLGLFESIKQWLFENEIDEKQFFAGKVVDKLDDIQLSFKSALSRERKALEIAQKAMEENASDSKFDKQKKLVDDVLAYLELHFKDANLGQVQVADEFEISNYTLSRMFKSYVGVGFAEYLIEKRLNYAKHLLLESDYSINDIALMSGFSSVHYFSRMFKASLDVTPSAFRKLKEQN